MRLSISAIRWWCCGVLIAQAANYPASACAQPNPNEPPLTYEVQVDGESFQVEGNRAVKVESKLKPGTSYNLAVRVALSQILRLNSVRLEYGMWAKVIDDKGKDLRIVQIVHELGFSISITDLGRALDEKRQDDLLKTLADHAVKRFTDRGATELKKTEAKSQKFGVSASKWSKITYKDSEGIPRSSMIFILSGDGYTVSVGAEYRDEDFEDMKTWLMNLLVSVQPLKG